MPFRTMGARRLLLVALAPLLVAACEPTGAASTSKPKGPKAPATTPTTAPPPSTTLPPPTTTVPPPPPAPTPPSGDRASASAGTTVGSTAYPVPASAIVVSPSGSNTAAGTAAAPYQTIANAIAKAPSGATIVVRAGTYHESLVTPSTKQLTIQSWPNEAVWLDGSKPLSGWVADGTAWRFDGWTTEFDASPTYTRGAPDGSTEDWTFVNPAHPMAAHPDQVWIGDVALRQVGSRAEVKAGHLLPRPRGEPALRREQPGGGHRARQRARCGRCASSDRAAPCGASASVGSHRRSRTWVPSSSTTPPTSRSSTSP